MRLILAKKNNNNISFLYKRYNNEYIFSAVPNVYFNTEEQAINFVNHNLYMFKDKINVDDTLYVLSMDNKSEVLKIDR